MAVVFVSHDVGVLASQVTTIACVNRRLLFWGSPDELQRGDLFQRLYGGASLLTHVHHLEPGVPAPGGAAGSPDRPRRG